MYSPSTSVSWLIILPLTMKLMKHWTDVSDKNLFWFFFSVSIAEERSNSLKTERETMFLKWACILKLFLIGGKTVS